MSFSNSLLQNYVPIAFSTTLVFIALAVTILVTGRRRSPVQGRGPTALLALSIGAVIASALVLRPGGILVFLSTLGCQLGSTENLCSNEGLAAAVLTLILGLPLLALGALMLAWLPKREPFTLRLVGAVAAFVSPLLPIWIVFWSGLFHTRS